MTNIMFFFTFLGNWKTILFLNLIIAIFLIKNKQLRLFAIIAFTSLSNLFIVEPLKHLFREPRPLNGLITETGFSFPSGHTYSAITFYGLLTYLLYERYKHKYIVLLGITFIFLIAYSRLYLGVHYFHDIIASLVLGSLFLIISTRLLKK